MSKFNTLVLLMAAIVTAISVSGNVLLLNKARHSNQGSVPVLVYDHVGIRDAWKAHLQWLDGQIRSVRAIKVSEAGWTLAGWEE